MDRLIYEQVYIDTNILIAGVEGFDQRAVELLACAERGDIYPVTSALTLTELLAKPERAGKYGARYAEIFDDPDRLTVADLSTEIAVEAASIIGKSSLELPDAVHCATARIFECEYFLTNDVTIQHAAEIEALSLNDLEPLTNNEEEGK